MFQIVHFQKILEGQCLNRKRLATPLYILLASSRLLVLFQFKDLIVKSFTLSCSLFFLHIFFGPENEFVDHQQPIGIIIKTTFKNHSAAICEEIVSDMGKNIDIVL